MPDGVPGDIEIHDDVLAEVAGFAALECYGIVGMASPTLRDGVAQLLSREKLRKGVVVHGHGDSVKIDLYVVIEHGANLTQVSHNLADRVRYDLQTIAGVLVDDIDVHVQGVKVRK
ncbi:MAG: Asp23/Gls24 family envelope stress response protein [Coriobacteriia bacterium]|jgi:uncharacterized alkaline shock family protein YloU|nr:Asp23/Gls24 family envelope stress response protein [Coriobacteriia bacterium]